MTRTFLALIAIGIMSACSALSANEPESAPDLSPIGEMSDFTFTSSGLQLSGVFDTPSGGEAEALVLFIHGYGPSDVRGWNSYADLRQRFNEIGIATAVWDKPGQGLSEGEFDINQSVYSSAQEVVDAASFLRDSNAPGADNIGIWGVSRAGWIAPIAMSQDAELEFWVSVSGTTAEDNFAYLLLSNLPHEGGTQEISEQLADEWRAGCELFRTGASFDQYQSATVALRANEYIKGMRGEWQTQAQYEAQQQSCEEGVCANIDQDMCSYVFIPDFDVMLGSLEVDVLAIFGEKDLNVDWRKTRDFYQATLADNPEASLAIKAFAGADHNLNLAETGSIREMQAMTAPVKVDGYYQVQVDWLREHVLEQQPTE